MLALLLGTYQGRHVMSFRVKACVATAAAACVLFTPAAMASPGISHAPVQVTGKQLKNGLLPPSHILPPSFPMAKKFSLYGDLKVAIKRAKLETETAALPGKARCSRSSSILRSTS